MQKTGPRTPDGVENAKAEALTKDFVMCAQRLGMSPQDAALTLGVSGEAESADALVRVTKRLHKLLGDSETAWRAWLRRNNDDFDAKPLDVIKQQRGAVKVASYLEGKGEL
jgi:hypothetical protein